MPDNRFIAVLTLLLVLRGGAPAIAQAPPQNIQQGTEKGEAPKPEAPKPVVNIVIDNARLSVELVDANMGETIQAIALKAGFSVEGDSSTLSKKLTTRFNDFDIDRGIMRLFSLAKETNYLISYNTKGEVSKLEIYGAAVSSAAKTPPATPNASNARRQVSSPAQPAATRPVITRPLPPVRPAPVRPLRPAPQPPSARQAPQPVQTPEPAPAEPAPQTMQEDQNPGEDVPSEAVKELPYVPPQRKPVYIPPIKR